MEGAVEGALDAGFVLVDKGGFEGSGGLEVFEEGVAGFVEGLFVFAEDEGVFGGEAVFEGIEANGGLAFGVLGPALR